MSPNQLTRVARVRAAQLTLARAAEAQAATHAASETALNNRVAQLAAAIAPTPSADIGFSITAAAHYRDRLHQTAAAAQHRVNQANSRAAAATDARGAAERDLKAVEKLQDKGDAAAALAAMRALEGAPLPVRRLRHDPC